MWGHTSAPGSPICSILSGAITRAAPSGVSGPACASACPRPCLGWSQVRWESLVGGGELPAASREVGSSERGRGEGGVARWPGRRGRGRRGSLPPTCAGASGLGNQGGQTRVQGPRAPVSLERKRDGQVGERGQVRGGRGGDPASVAAGLGQRPPGAQRRRRLHRFPWPLPESLPASAAPRTKCSCWLKKMFNLVSCVIFKLT